VSRPFEILEHTADIGFRAWGATEPELFANAAAATIAISYEPDAVAERETRDLVATGDDRESLMVNWLQELLWLIDGEGWLPRRIAVHTITATSIAGTAHGEPRDASRHEFNVIVKAVTYHQIKVSSNEAEVFLDI